MEKCEMLALGVGGVTCAATCNTRLAPDGSSDTFKLDCTAEQQTIHNTKHVPDGSADPHQTARQSNKIQQWLAPNSNDTHIKQYSKTAT